MSPLPFPSQSCSIFISGVIKGFELLRVFHPSLLPLFCHSGGKDHN